MPEASPMHRIMDLHADKDIVILGGGTSIHKVDLSLLKNWIVIGINDSGLQMKENINAFFFGDKKYWDKRKAEILRLRMPVITNNPLLENEKGLIWLPRKANGFHKDAIGWNGNSGASAINVALIMGARKIYLLGFDMQYDSQGKANWYENDLQATETHFEQWKRKMKRCDFKGFEKCQCIINLNVDSAMDAFPKERWENVLNKAI